MRLILGLIKGLVLGLAVGYGATRLGLISGSLGFAAAAAAGLVVGFLCGKAPWRQETIFTPIVKGIVGALLSAGLFWVGRRFLGGMAVPAAILEPLSLKDGATVMEAPGLLVGAIGAVYGAFVEVDDGGKTPPKAA